MVVVVEVMVEGGSSGVGGIRCQCMLGLRRKSQRCRERKRERSIM
jgi:hypothetical protein